MLLFLPIVMMRDANLCTAIASWYYPDPPRTSEGGSAPPA